MTDRWELLGFRTLSAEEASAQRFDGTLVIHREGSTEPVETVQVTASRAVLVEMRGFLDRLLKRTQA